MWTPPERSPEAQAIYAAAEADKRTHPERYLLDADALATAAFAKAPLPGDDDGDCREEAVKIARVNTPATKEALDPHDPDGLTPGTPVTVAAIDYGREPIPGTLVAASPQHVAIRRSDPAVGDVVVHFPRAGFTVQARG